MKSPVLLLTAIVFAAVAFAADVPIARPLINVSVRSIVPDGGVITVGFIIDSPRTVLIRGIGPSLGQFNVSGTMPDPTIRVFNSSGVEIEQNGNWGGPSFSFAGLEAMARVGAFPITSANDAAIYVRLPAGGYTVQMRGADGRGGDAIIEVYDTGP